MLGEAPSLRNFFVAAGFNSIGIQTAGGAGKAIAEWMEAGEPTHGSHRRRHPPHASPSTATRPISPTASARRSACTMPTSSPIAAPRARAACAPRRCTSGWRSAAPASARPPAGSAPPGSCPRRRARAARRPSTATAGGGRTGSSYAAEEHKAVRTGVGLFDLSPFGKIRVEGRDAEAVLQRICANDVAVAPGRIVYTQWLNAQRRHRGRPDRHAPLRRRVPRRDVVGDRAARSGLAEAPHRRTARTAWRPTSPSARPASP